MRTINGNIYYNSNDEEPDCIQCVYVTDDPEKYCDRCGPACGWRHYVREEAVEVEE